MSWFNGYGAPMETHYGGKVVIALVRISLQSYLTPALYRYKWKASSQTYAP